MTMTEIYDLDWNEITETTVEDVQTPPQGYQVVNLQQSRVPAVVNSMVGCSRRLSNGRNTKPMLKTALNFAIQLFRDRFVRHGAQEGDDHTADRGDGERRAERQLTNAKEEDGKCQDSSSLEEVGQQPVDHDVHSTESNGCGPHSAEERLGGRDQREEIPDYEDRQEEGENGMDQPGHRETNAKVNNSEVLVVRTGDMSTSNGTPTLPSQPLRDVVDMPSMRKQVGKNSGRQVSFVVDNSDSRSTPCKEVGHSKGSLSGSSACPQVKTGTRCSSTESGEGTSHYINAELYTRDYVNVHEYDERTNWISTRALRRETPAFGTESNKQDQKDKKGWNYHTRGTRDPGDDCQPQRGACGGLGGDQSKWRILASQDQLDGKHGSKLRDMLRTKFPKFHYVMVLLCMNCVLTQSTTTAFGTPDAVIYNTGGGEFKQVDFCSYEPPKGEHFASCYVYTGLGEYVNQNIPAIDGVSKVLPRPVRRHLVATLKKKIYKPDVTEVYSPPRVTLRATKHGLKPGGALDLSTGWDLSKPDVQKKALDLIALTKPALVILSPPCTTFSALRNLSNFKRNQDTVHKEEQEGRLHVEFSVRVALLQIANGRGFMFEHPLAAKSWTTTSLKDLRNTEGVFEIKLDMCRFGLKTSQADPALKPTLLLTNIEALVSPLSKRCQGQHVKHGPLLSGEAAGAARYTNAFVDAILRGLKQHVHTWIKTQRPQEDYWTFQEDSVVRYHRTPRRALFTPNGVPGCPINPAKLSSDRTTFIEYDNGQTTTFQDNWRATDTPHLCQPRPWTGSTTFRQVQAVVLPKDWQNLATFISSSAACPLHDYLTDESEFQCEWSAVFPTRRILRGAEGHVDGEEAELEDALAPEANVRVENNAADEDEIVVGQELRELQPMNQRQEPGELHPTLRREVYRLHRNLGHPNKQSFLRALRHAGVKEEVLAWVKNGFHCPLCERNQKSNPHRPGHLQKNMTFNQVVGIDLFKTHEKLFLNCLCWGTDLQMVKEIPSKRPEDVLSAFYEVWMAHYGPPSLVVADQGKEFIGSEFADKIGEMGVPVHYIDVRSPWQNSRTERAGGIFKTRLETVLHEATVSTPWEFTLAVYECVIAHNRYYHRSGYTPYQRAFGILPRLPASLLSDDFIDKELILNGAGDEVKRSWEIREAAGNAWLRWQDDDAVRRAISTRTRTSDNKVFKEGDLVYVWRDVPNFKGWSGPGTIVAQHSNGKSLWVSLRGYLVKASREQIRHATSEESLGAELVKNLSQDMLQDLESGKLRNYKDVEGEGVPEDPDYEPSIARQEEGLPSIPEEETVNLDMEIDELLGPEPVPRREHGGDLRLPAELPQPMDDGEISTQHPESHAGSESARPSSTNTPGPSAPSSRRASLRVDEGRSGSMPFGPVTSDTPRSSRSSAPYPFNRDVPPLPTPPQNFMEVCVDHDSQGARWRRNGTLQVLHMVAAKGGKFHSNNSMGIYNNKDKCIYLTKAKTSPGQVEFRKLSSQHLEIFRKARAKEVKSLLDSGAIKILSLEESEKFRRENPEHVLNSRYVDRWKPTEAFSTLPENFDAEGFKPESHPGLAAKSRWCVVGWTDPHIHEIERTSPTPLTSSMYLFLQLAASRRWSAKVKDAKTAFLQSRPTTRKQKLCCRMPSDECFEGYNPKQLILLLTEVYGLVSGPAWWRRSLLEILVKELGYRVNVYDRCVLTLDGADGKDTTEGVIILEVDDILEAGTAIHQKKMELLEKRLRFGKVVSLTDVQEGTGYAGRRITQSKEDYSFTYTMDDYVANRLQQVVLDRKVLKKDAAQTKLTSEEETRLRGAIAAINWASREGRPDGSAAASILSGCFPGATVADVNECNQVVEILKQRKVTIKIHSIPEGRLRHLLISDSSFDPTGKTKPQHGWIQAMSTPELNAGKPAPVSLISWRSKKIRRKAGSTSLAESVSLSTALGAMEKQYAMMMSIRFSKFDPRNFAEDTEIQLGLRGSPTVIASEDPKYLDPDTVAVVDAKSIFDSTSNPGSQFQGECDRSALEAAIIQESLAKLRARLRWLPRNLNPADALTKLPGQAHMAPMYQMLKTHSMVIQQEATELSMGRQGDNRKKERG